MAGLVDDEMAWLTARAGIGRAGTIRAACVPRRDQLLSDASLIWKRPIVNNGDPDNTVNAWTTGREA